MKLLLDQNLSPVWCDASPIFTQIHAM